MLLVAFVACLAVVFVSGAMRRALRVTDRAVLSAVMDGTRQPGELGESRLWAELMAGVRARENDHTLMALLAAPESDLLAAPESVTDPAR